MPTLHKRTCHICEANCGIIVEMEGRKTLSIKGNPDHVLSRGHICPKATAIADIQDDPDRLRKPIKKVNGEWQEIDWEIAFTEIAEQFAKIRTQDKNISLYTGNPNAHDYAVTTTSGMFRRVLGQREIYSASTLDQIPHHLSQLLMYGHVSLAAVPDIDRCMNLVILGGNPAASNGSLWTVPDFKKRVIEMQARGGNMTVVDPRKTETAKLADHHYFVKPGTDTALLIALFKALDEGNMINPDAHGTLTPYLDDGLSEAQNVLGQFSIDNLTSYCGIEESDIRDIAARLGGDTPSALYGRMGVSVCAFGSLNHWLIQLINIATGNLNREGGTMFPQPSLDLVRVLGGGSFRMKETRNGPVGVVMGEKSTAGLADDILEAGEDQVRALYVMSGNPVLSSPNGRKLDQALESLEFMVSQDMYITETSRHADYILPPCGPLEKDHYPIFFGPLSIRNVASYSPATLPMEEGTKSDGDIIAELTRAIAIAYDVDIPNIRTPRENLDRMLRASPAGLTLADVEATPDGIDLGALKPCLPDRLCTEDKIIKVAPEILIGDVERFKDVLSANDAIEDSLSLIGRRHVRNNNSWLHNSQRLLKGKDRCTLMIHPDDAANRGINDADLTRVQSRVGVVEVIAEISDDVMQGVVSIPHGFGHSRDGVKLSVASAKPGVSINDLTDPAHIDPLTGNAVLNGTPVTVKLCEDLVAAE